MKPDILLVQLAFAAVAAAVYFVASVRRDKGKKMDGARFLQIVSAAVAAMIVPFGAVVAYSAYDPSVLDWLKEGNYRQSLFILGCAAVLYALIHLHNNWPR